MQKLKLIFLLLNNLVFKILTVGIRKFKPTTPGRRWMTVNTFEEITTSSPYKPLTVNLKKHAGRNNTWRITVRHQWSGHAQKYRLVDFSKLIKKVSKLKLKL